MPSLARAVSPRDPRWSRAPRPAGQAGPAPKTPYVAPKVALPAPRAAVAPARPAAPPAEPPPAAPPVVCAPLDPDAFLRTLSGFDCSKWSELTPAQRTAFAADGLPRAYPATAWTPDLVARAVATIDARCAGAAPAGQAQAPAAPSDNGAALAWYVVGAVVVYAALWEGWQLLTRSEGRGARRAYGRR